MTTRNSRCIPILRKTGKKKPVRLQLIGNLVKKKKFTKQLLKLKRQLKLSWIA